MPEPEIPESEPILEATKDGPTIVLSSDPDPSVKRYVVFNGAGILLLLPEPSRTRVVSTPLQGPRATASPSRTRDELLRRAFTALGARVSVSDWSRSMEPHAYLKAGFSSLRAQRAVAEDVLHYLDENPSVAAAAQMLFTSIAMSARANWEAAPIQHRGTAARGWFLGRWIPTFLVLDGPILRFLKSKAFRRQQGPNFLRSIRAFFESRDFMALRHAFAHWSFTWSTENQTSEVVVISTTGATDVRLSWAEADAFHILTFAVVETLYDAFMRLDHEPSPPKEAHEAI